MNRRLLLGAVVGALLTTSLSACAGSDAATTTPAVTDAPAAPSGSVVASGSVAGADPAADPTTAPAAQEIPAAGAPADLCATVPSLDAINAVLDEPVAVLTDLPRGPGEAVCQATGEGASSVQFDVLSGVTDQAMRDLATEMGATVTDLSDPAGGFAYAATAVAIIDGTAYSVQAITFDVIMDPNTPEAIERSAGLLRQWLALMGLG